MSAGAAGAAYAAEEQDERKGEVRLHTQLAQIQNCVGVYQL